LHKILPKFINSCYENYFFTKITFFKKFKSFLFPFNYNFLHKVFTKSYILWEKIFKIKFWINRKKKLSLTVFKNKNKNKKISDLKGVFFFKIIKFNNFFNLIKNNFIIFFFYNNVNKTLSILFLNFFKTNLNFSLSFKDTSVFLLDQYKRTFGEGYYYIRGLFIIFFIDACVTDDEPLWEPIEWSLVQTWLLFIFIFAWIAENLITSRYGSYTGRDKRVWLAWYKSFWLVDLFYAISYGAASLFVIVPFYFELTYSVSFIFNWWNWYTRVFFFKFISIFTIIILIAHLLQLNIRWLNWKKLILFILIINFFIAYLLFTHFIMTFFGYFTDPLWYQKTRFVDYIQLSHEPLKWGWGPAKRDHFTYHKVTTVFWFKNDGPFAGAFLTMHIFFFLTIFFLYIYWVTLLRRVYTTEEVTYTFTVFCISSLKQFYYFFFLLYIFIFMSFIVCYWRFPVEFLWLVNSNSWFLNFIFILKDYFYFIISIF
jgi:hypothetical protein